MIKHHTSLSMDNFKNRLKAGMYRGIGQMFTQTLTQGNFSFIHFMRFKLLHLFIAMIIGFCFAIFDLISNGDKLLLLIFAGIIVLIWLVSCYIKRGIKNGTYSLYRWIAINMQILRGIFDHTPQTSKYPQDVIIIQKSEKKI